MGDISTVVPYRKISSSDSTYNADYRDGLILAFNRSSSLSLVLPARISTPPCPIGKIFYIINDGTASITVTIDGGEKFLNNGSIAASSITVGSYHCCTVIYIDGMYAVLSYR